MTSMRALNDVMVIVTIPRSVPVESRFAVQYLCKIVHAGIESQYDAGAAATHHIPRPINCGTVSGTPSQGYRDMHANCMCRLAFSSFLHRC